MILEILVVLFSNFRYQLVCVLKSEFLKWFRMWFLCTDLVTERSGNKKAGIEVVQD